MHGFSFPCDVSKHSWQRLHNNVMFITAAAAVERTFGTSKQAAHLFDRMKGFFFNAIEQCYFVTNDDCV